MAKNKKKVSQIYLLIKGIVGFFYPHMNVVGEENLPEGEAILVGNHAQLHGPIISELYLPGSHVTWCAGEMMEWKEVSDYAYRDFWSGKPRYIRWCYRLLSYLITPLAVCIFNNANTIGVYHDARILSTFKKTVQHLTEGDRVVIFPEQAKPYNPILCAFQDKFIDVAKLYHKRTGKELSFVPMYIAPRLKTVYLGKPIAYCSENKPEQERSRISSCLMEQITEMAVSLPLPCSP